MKKFNAILAAALAVLGFIGASYCCAGAKKNDNALEAQNAGQKNEGKETMQKTYLRPNVAGAFYPGNPVELKQTVSQMIASGRNVNITDDVYAILSPHAGYVYSGPVAGSGFKAVSGRRYKTVVVIAFSHSGGGGWRDNPIVTTSVDAFITPLGEIPTDAEGAKKLAASSNGLIGDSPRPFRGEHSLEVQLPFIQVALGEGYKLLPILFIEQSPESAEALANLLFASYGLDKDVLFVGSTDMSHYYDYKTAQAMDAEALKLVKSGNVKQFWNVIAAGKKAEFCGPAVVATLMGLNALMGGNEPVVADVRNSGDTSGRSDKVVGYSSVLFTVKAGVRADNANNADDKIETDAPKTGYTLTENEKAYLLKLARNTVEAAVKKQKEPDASDAPAKLKEKGAAFVTIKKNGELRGCIGHIIAYMPLVDCIKSVGASAALQDPRFPPMKPDELAKVEVEVSVLTPPEKVNDLEKIVVGKHGLIMKNGTNQGVLLPQVPVEWGWEKETFLKQTCHKAGLSQNCYKDPKTEIYAFEAIVFNEGNKK